MQQQEQNSQETTSDDWSELRLAIAAINEWRANNGEVLPIPFFAFRSVCELVPKLLDRYAELWEMSMQMMSAWEGLEKSKNSLYVPDAAEMVANHEAS